MQKEVERKQAETIAKQKHDESVAKSRAKGGLFSQLTAVAKDVAYHSVAAVESGVKETKKAVNHELDSRAVTRFNTHFPSLKAEKLLWNTSGKIISGGAPIDGELFITAHFLAFSGFYNDSKSKPGDTIRRAVSMCVPIASIISIQLALASWPKDTPVTAAPQIAPLQPGQVGTALMVFCSDRSLHLLYQFSALSDVLNVLDHQWRAIVDTNRVNLMPMTMQMGQPMMQPMMAQPVMGLGQPMIGQPMMGQPMMGQPMMGQPMMGQPMMGQPYGGQVVGQPAFAAPAPSAPPSDDLYPHI